MTATLQPESKSSSRRALLAGALGGLGALAASAIGRPYSARATNGDAVTVGGSFTATGTTKISNSTNTSNVLWGDSTSGTGVYGSSGSWIAIRGQSISSIAVYGASSSSTQPASLGQSTGDSSGVQGVSGAFGLPAPKAKTGVYGYAAQDNFSRGVIGESPAGIGVYGISASGYGGYFAGKVYTTKWYELSEISAPAAPLTNRARLFVRDNGAGKTQLCVRFNTGAIKVLATQP